MKISKQFIRLIPKADLHVHLGGSLRLSTLIELARKDGIPLPAYTEKELRQKVFKPRYRSLPEYLKGFDYTGAILRSKENLQRVAYELAQDALAEGVRYMEVRFAPQLHTAEHVTMADVVRAVAAGMSAAQKEYNSRPDVRSGKELPFYFGLIVCAMRSFHENSSFYYRRLFQRKAHLAKSKIFGIASLALAHEAVRLVREENLPIVGFDLAGKEAGYPAAVHKQAYQYVHKHFLRKTVHSGEAYGPESIFSAITDCYANRIGHGTHLFDKGMIKGHKIKDKTSYIEELADYIARERIGMEVCLTSNLQTMPAIKSVAQHPVREMIKRGLSVSICTDNRLVSDTTVTRELELLVENLPLTAQEFKHIIVSGFKKSFFPGTYMEKRAFVRQMLTRYDELAAKYLA